MLNQEKDSQEKMTHSEKTTRIRIAIMTIAALTLVFAAVPHAQAAALHRDGLGERGPGHDDVCPRPIPRDTRRHN